jgi:small-conductance mechanosensitive channel
MIVSSSLERRHLEEKTKQLRATQKELEETQQLLKQSRYTIPALAKQKYGLDEDSMSLSRISCMTSTSSLDTDYTLGSLLESKSNDSE